MKRRTKKNKFNKYILICSFIALFTLCFAVSGIFAAADEKDNRVYTSVEINSGDTLWSIAEEYCDTDSESITEYIDNIKEINNLGSDQITSGNYLIIYENK